MTNLAIRAFVVIVFLLCAFDAGAHGEHTAPETAETTDHASIDSADGYHVELKMEPGFASVGQMSTLRAAISRKDGTAVPAELTLICFNLDHQNEVFRGVFTRSDGKLEIQFQFVDGADHRVSLLAKPLEKEKASPAPIAVEMNVAVQAKQPPAPIVARTLAFLVGVAALALVAGFVVAAKWPKAD